MATVGETLRAVRLEKGLDTSTAAAATRLKVQIIEDLENNDFSAIAAPVYGKGFIKLYADYLGLDSGPLIQDYLSQCGLNAEAPVSGRRPSGVLESEAAGAGEQGEGDASVGHPVDSSGHRDSANRDELWQKRMERMKIAFIEEPVKCSLVAFAVLVLFVFLVSGLIRCAGF